MKELEQLYRVAPKRKSPVSLDQEILRQAEKYTAHAVANNEAKRPLRSSWMPIAASFVVVGFGLALVLRNDMLGTLSDDTQLDGYPEALMEVDRSVQNTLTSTATVAGDKVDKETGASDKRESSFGDAIDSLAESQQLTPIDRSTHRRLMSNEEESSFKQSRRSSDGVEQIERSLPNNSAADVSVTGTTQANQHELSAAVATQGIATGEVEPDPLASRKFGAKAGHSNEALSGVADISGLTQRSASPAASSPVVRSPAVIPPALESPIVLPLLMDQSAQDWLMEQQKGFYTLQLATAEDQSYLAEFAQSIAQSLRPGFADNGEERVKQQDSTLESQKTLVGQDRQFVVLTLPDSNRSGMPWYTLLTGVFIDFEEAQALLDQLPVSVTQFGASVRSLGRLQDLSE